MKHILLIAGLIVCSLSFSQDVKLMLIDGQAKQDTLKGADTIYFRTPELKRANFLSAIQVECYEVTGSSTNDYIIGQTSITGGLYATLNTTQDVVYTFPNDTLDIEDQSTMVIDVVAISNNYFGFKCVGGGW